METILEENSHILEEMLEKAVEEPGDVRRCYTVWRERILILREPLAVLSVSC